MVNRSTSLFNSFCSIVARQVARFLLPVFRYLKFLLNPEQVSFSSGNVEDFEYSCPHKRESVPNSGNFFFSETSMIYFLPRI